MPSQFIFCAYHPTHRALVRCSACHRPLCPACDHRIKGFPYCQECIVRGVELLRRSTRWTSAEAPRRPPSPRLAALCALVPGLGAVYNRQNVKAFVHFLLIVGFFELADVTDLALFGFGGAVFYLFSILDAYRTAEAIARGMDPVEEDDRLRQLLREHLAWVALGLILLGGFILVSDVIEALRISLAGRHLWPLVLIALGAYLLYRSARLRASSGRRSFDRHRPPPPLFWKTGPLTGSLVETESSDEPKPPAKGPRW
ncbi:MAG: hypothetical protein N0A16_04710 [Blastocatellia bacterium]|nr:hypothetical protein [Blastocatellia bacterium]MCS7157013.1 hypothetical protein [Blastocatellia bacterium]MCX7752214.1 hypothetical protein [Blastocatellia bacterium]MDW8167706.1 hypothetical protein [Acidobacteriota bacterium]MDW8256305.1 hypothetical protein [Acidobacteriota bacterium]